MSENADATESFTRANALEALRSVEGYEEGLRRRTEGATWMVWGFAVAGIFASYAAGNALIAETPALRPWMPFLWAPWVLAGWLATFALWHSASLSTPNPEALGTPGDGLRALATWSVLFLGVFITMAYVRPSIDASVVALLLSGLIPIALAVAPARFLSFTSTGRRFMLVGGLLITLGAGAAFLLAFEGTAAAAFGAFVGGAVWLVGGFVVTLRG